MENAYILLGLFAAAIAVFLLLVGGPWQNALGQKRRRWMRIKVPHEKKLACRILEPFELASDIDYLVDDINMGGISFFSDKEMVRGPIQLLLKFPLATYKEAGVVNARVAYCRKMPDGRYRVGVAYLRRK